jgi:hypothetical protein
VLFVKGLEAAGWNPISSIEVVAEMAPFGAKLPPLTTGYRWMLRSDRLAQTLCHAECNLL